MFLLKLWNASKRLVVMIVGVAIMAGALSACGSTAPRVVGKTLPDAIHRLEGAGYEHIVVVDDHGMTITQPHYEDGYDVTEQDHVGPDVLTSTTITLTVTKSKVAPLVSTPSATPTPTSTPSPTPSPTPTPEATTPEPEPTTEEPAEEPAPPAPAPAPARAPARTYYKNCKEAREAGAAPLYEGDPGYSPHLDRDKDGIACE